MGIRLSINGRIYDKDGGGTYEHDLLINRELPDAHPISSITDLSDIIDDIYSKLGTVFSRFVDTNTVRFTSDILTETIKADIILSEHYFYTFYDEVNQKLYRVVKIPNITWYEAEQWCEKYGGTLACPHTVEEMDFLNTVLSEVTEIDKSLWLGASSFPAEYSDDYAYFIDSDDKQFVENSDKDFAVTLVSSSGTSIEIEWSWINDNSIIDYDEYWISDDVKNISDTDKFLVYYKDDVNSGVWNALPSDVYSNEIYGFVFNDLIGEQLIKNKNNPVPNALRAFEDGLYAPDYTGFIYNLFDSIKNKISEYEDTNTVSFSYDESNKTLQADVKISDDSGNALEIRDDGLYVANKIECKGVTDEEVEQMLLEELSVDIEIPDEPDIPVDPDDDYETLIENEDEQFIDSEGEEFLVRKEKTDEPDKPDTPVDPSEPIEPEPEDNYETLIENEDELFIDRNDEEFLVIKDKPDEPIDPSEPEDDGCESFIENEDEPFIDSEDEEFLVRKEEYKQFVENNDKQFICSDDYEFYVL